MSDTAEVPITIRRGERRTFGSAGTAYQILSVDEHNRRAHLQVLKQARNWTTPQRGQASTRWRLDILAVAFDLVVADTAICHPKSVQPAYLDVEHTL